MAKYYIQNQQEFNTGNTIIYYQGNNTWTTEYENRKIYSKKVEAKAELYDFGGTIVKDSVFNPNAIDRDGDGIVQEETEFERSVE